MSFLTLTPELVTAIHDEILNPGEMKGRAQDKSLDGALARVGNRLIYGLIIDVFDLAAAYSVAIAQGHCFNDGNKLTAHQAMDVCLDLNGVQIAWTATEIGPAIIRAAQRLMDEAELAQWLRQRAG
ncbi:MAG: type II toxin-antitoxin system death-on-curing family toxin [Paracoccaceae bacterium]